MGVPGKVYPRGGTLVYAMVSPPGMLGPLMYRAFRAAAYDLPEDFIQRVSPGLDTEARASLERGLDALRMYRRIDRLMLSLLAAGALFFLAGAGIVLGLRMTEALGGILIYGTFAMWLGAILCLLALVVLSLAYRPDLRRVMAFYRALQGSSLARDLA